MNHRRRLLGRGRGFKSRGRHFFTYDGTRGHASRQNYYGNICRHLFTNGTRGTRAGTAATPGKRRHKTTSEENKQFDPGEKGEKVSL